MQEIKKESENKSLLVTKQLNDVGNEEINNDIGN